MFCVDWGSLSQGTFLFWKLLVSNGELKYIISINPKVSTDSPNICPYKIDQPLLNKNYAQAIA